jgi:hypothetical protein
MKEQSTRTRVVDLPVTKAEIVSNIAENLGLEIENLIGLEKAPKATLRSLEIATGAQKDV